MDSVDAFAAVMEALSERIRALKGLMMFRTSETSDAGAFLSKLDGAVGEMEGQIQDLEAYIAGEEAALSELDQVRAEMRAQAASVDVAVAAARPTRPLRATRPKPAQAPARHIEKVYVDPQLAEIDDGAQAERYASNSNARESRALRSSLRSSMGGNRPAAGKTPRTARRKSSMGGSRRRSSAAGPGSLRSSLRSSMGSSVRPSSIFDTADATGTDQVWIEPLEDEEIDAIPHYLRGRLTKEKINAAAAELSAFIQSKYELMATSTRAMSNAQLHQYKAYRSYEIHGKTEGEKFFVEADIRNFSHIKVDRTGRSILHILRTTGRLREIRDTNCVRYAVTIY
ncbi:uncharacterized protein AMSG_01528 [Thecamonas trahens ATCC 50062]|uniref:Spindle and kinetochore-associated protein 1 n=1 Tax=Thecamonas trahens ATCC 50062 TaxID=461836 RepID=A0A0L0DQW6_THETB|nr:hypothetical protein AMSG_01528 [Thecamonas trahens ATCC 50062]KNC54677.1 hypothetical protein AMSG_01528 [Thecamonas trahens ATCC 50062]|eukprot:XP_013761579.1 hypothetical protein AMSG_01528 [Thecamonas trahens ATCC 50062]